MFIVRKFKPDGSHILLLRSFNHAVNGFEWFHVRTIHCNRIVFVFVKTFRNMKIIKYIGNNEAGKLIMRIRKFEKIKLLV